MSWEGPTLNGAVPPRHIMMGGAARGLRVPGWLVGDGVGRGRVPAPVKGGPMICRCRVVRSIPSLGRVFFTGFRKPVSGGRERRPRARAEAASPLGGGPGWSRTRGCSLSYEAQGRWKAAKAWATCESWCPGLRSPWAEGDGELCLRSASGGGRGEAGAGCGPGQSPMRAPGRARGRRG